MLSCSLDVILSFQMKTRIRDHFFPSRTAMCYLLARPAGSGIVFVCVADESAFNVDHDPTLENTCTATPHIRACRVPCSRSFAEVS